jgi:hypothetical protein
LELIVIIAYLASDILGIKFMSMSMIYIFTRKYTFLKNMIIALIFAIPTFNIGLAGKS